MTSKKNVKTHLSEMQVIRGNEVPIGKTSYRLHWIQTQGRKNSHREKILDKVKVIQGTNQDEKQEAMNKERETTKDSSKNKKNLQQENVEKLYDKTSGSRVKKDKDYKLGTMDVTMKTSLH